MSEEEFLVDFDAALKDVKTTDKVQIHVLTDLAKVTTFPDMLSFRRKLAELIRNRIRTAPADPNEVLPAIYVMDSILKNVGGSFIDIFAEGLKELFFHAFFRMSNGRTRLVHVLDTWKGLFPSALVDDIKRSVPAPGAVVVPAVHMGLAPAPPVVVAPAPVLKKQRIENVLKEQEREIEMQTLQMLRQLEQQVRSQGYPASPQQLRNIEDLRSVLMELHNDGQQQQQHQQQQQRIFVPMPQQQPQQHQFQPPPLPQQHQQRPVIAAAPVQSVGLVVPRTDLPPPSFKDVHAHNPRALEQIYSIKIAGRPCPNCALRFRDEESYRQHLDWHFKQNKRDQERVKRPQSRAWFVPLTQWHQDLGADAASIATVAPFDDEANKQDGGGHSLAGKVKVEQDDGKAARVPVDESQKTCMVCAEPFSRVWDDDEQEWMYDDAVLTPKGIVHKICQ